VITAMATQPNLHSYVLQVDRIGRRQQPFAGILCATDRPSTQQLPLPQLKDKKLVCPTKTHQVDIGYPISTFLFKVP
jgi:hypothetical protein